MSTNLCKESKNQSYYQLYANRDGVTESQILVALKEMRIFKWLFMHLWVHTFFKGVHVLSNWENHWPSIT